MSAIELRVPRVAASGDAVVAARIALVLIAIAAAAAAIVAMTGPAAAGEWLGFGFGGIEPRFGKVVAILANNLRVLAGVMIATGAVQLALRARPESTGHRAIVGLCDGGLALVAGAHALLVGLGVGAYGGRMVAALLPHGPVELAAYSVALALYVQARRRPLGVRRFAGAGLVAVLGLAVAAPLEVILAP